MKRIKNHQEAITTTANVPAISKTNLPSNESLTKPYFKRYKKDDSTTKDLKRILIKKSWVLTVYDDYDDYYYDDDAVTDMLWNGI